MSCTLPMAAECGLVDYKLKQCVLFIIKLLLGNKTVKEIKNKRERNASNKNFKNTKL